MNGSTMDGERAVVLDVSEALYAAAERLPHGSPWIDAFCEIAQLIEGDTGPGKLSASERLRRRGIQARARISSRGARAPVGSPSKVAHGKPRDVPCGVDVVDSATLASPRPPSGSLEEFGSPRELLRPK
jgi:hypothetical protein